MTVYVSNTNVLDLTGLRDARTLAYINDADVTVTVKNAAGEEVEGQTWPTTMEYTALSDGNYSAILQDTLELAPKTTYYAHVEADAGTDRIARWTFEFKPVVRPK